MYTLPILAYGYDAMEPYIDAQTMQIHHTRHHQTYIDKLNAGLTGTQRADMDIVELLSHMGDMSDNLKNIVRNHGGGHYNHSLFWESLYPEVTNISDSLKLKLEQDFGTIDEFKTKFAEQAIGLFGSGRLRLEQYTDGSLHITSYPNQENPIMYGYTPILGLDLREHAYYLSYQNRRADYISARWNIINRDIVSTRLG